MTYDFDLIVIGAGPAGLSAAIRARWVKTAEAIPASVLLIDPGGIGGLAGIGSICLTGPSFKFVGKDLIAKLAEDIEQFEIPVLRESAIGLRREEGFWIVQTPERSLRCLAVVVAVGLRRYTDEPKILQDGKLIFLSGGYTLAAERFRGWSETHSEEHLVIVGGESLRDALPAFLAVDTGRNKIDIMCEPYQQVSHLGPTGEQVVINYEEAGRTHEITCDTIMLDFHSLQLAPPSMAFLPPEMRDATGYSAIGPHGDLQWPGLFAAGDCAGPPSMTLKAMAQGAEAGFNAYMHICRHKFAKIPPLFAFYASPERLPFGMSELPEIDPAVHIPVGLSRRSYYAGHPLAGYGDKTTLTANIKMEEIKAEVADKIATVHRR